jgi:DNA-binding NarL/FixJ family response regulator
MRLGANDGERRPRVLLADDHAAVLAEASTLLATDFDVVAAVGDGQQALNASLRLNPDVAILDIRMPGLDGLQTTRELKRAGSQAKIIMLTTYDLDAYVAAAIQSGGHGYVVKTRMFSDLPSAIDHALAGRLFVPSLTSLPVIAQPGAGTHAVEFRLSDRASWDKPSRLLCAALQRGEVATIIATHATRDRIAQRLIGWGCDLAHAEEQGKYLSLDAEDALSQVMVDGRLDAGRVAAVVDDLERRRLAAGSASRLTIVGEIAVPLCRDGKFSTAIQLERLWDDLTRALPFFTVCVYPTECFREGGPELFLHICAPHSAVCHAA